MPRSETRRFFRSALHSSKRMPHLTRRIKRLGDARVLIRAICLALEKTMIQAVNKKSTDTDERAFTPLADSTVARKQKQGLSLQPLVATGAMVNPKSFGIRAGKKKGRIWHKVPRGAHSKYGTGKMRRTSSSTLGQRLGQSTPETERMRRYDYGLAHQYSKRAKLPRRQWWLEPGTKKWAWMQDVVIPRMTHEFMSGSGASASGLLASVVKDLR